MYNFEGNFNPCVCKNKKCQCGEGLHSYVKHYTKILDTMNIKTCYEWGPGKNTFMCLERNICVHSKEFDQKWRLKIDNPLYTSELVNVSDTNWKIIETPKKWDLYFIDSRERNECLKSVYDVCNYDSLVCLHDAQRIRYYEGLSKFKYVYFYSRGFCVATKSKEKYEILKKME